MRKIKARFSFRPLAAFDRSGWTSLRRFGVAAAFAWLSLMMPGQAAAQERRVYVEVWTYDDSGNHVGTQIRDCDGRVTTSGTYTNNTHVVERQPCDPEWTERSANWADGSGRTNDYGPPVLCYTECISYPSDNNWCKVGSPCCTTYCY